MTSLASGQPSAVHEIRAPGHGLPHQYQLAGGLLHKALRGYYLNAALRNRFGCDNAVDTAKVINVAVGKNDRPHWPLWQVLMGKRKGCGGCFLTSKRINQNPPSLSFNEGHIGKIKPSKLINPRSHLEQSANVVKGGLLPEAWVDRSGRSTGNEIVGIGIPDGSALISTIRTCLAMDMKLLGSGDMSPPGINEGVAS